jgi:TonB family protein
MLSSAVAVLLVAWGSGTAVAQDMGQGVGPPRKQEPAHTPQLTKPPKLLTTVEAVYPPEAQAEQLSADVTMNVDIDAEGRPSRVEVTKPAGHGFDEAARDAVLQYRFSPAEIDGKPAAIRIAYTLHFVPKMPPPEGADVETSDAGAPDAAPPPPPPPPEVVVVGRLREKGTRNPLSDGEIAVIVHEADGTDKPATVVGSTESDGRFQIRGQPGLAMRVIITETGHDPCVRDLLAPDVRADKPVEIDCLVRRRIGTIYETKVRAPPPAQAVTRYVLTQPELTSVPGTFGDPLRVIQNLPGVARTPFGLGALVIRGAPPGDSGIYVEGHQIPILYHFLGGPSVLTPRLIDRIDFFPGNFGVKYGRATAGIVDVGVKGVGVNGYGSESDVTPRLHGQVDINLLDSSAYVEGPLAKGWTGSVSARRSYIDLLLPLVLPSSTTTAAPVYYDYQAVVNREVPGGRVSLFGFGSNDSLKVISKDPSTGDINLNTDVGFHKVIGVWVQSVNGWTNRLSPAYGWERQRLNGGIIAINQTANVLALRDEVTHSFSPRLLFRVGFDGELRRDSLFFDLPVPPDSRLYGDTIPMQMQRTVPLDTMAAGVYTDLTMEAGHGVTIIPGLRSDGFRYVGQDRLTFDPRLVARWRMNPKHLWKAGVGIYHQMPQPQLLDPTLGNPNLPPIWADQYSFGFVHDITQRISLDTTFYFVRRHDEPVPPAPFTPAGKGRAYGMELILKHEFTERFFGWLAYTLSRSEQTTYAVNSVMVNAPGGLQTGMPMSPQYFPTDFDQTHNLIVVASYAFSTAWRIGARYRLVTGSPTTPVYEGVFDAESGTYVCRMGPTNSARQPTFSQLDFRAERLWTFSAWQFGAYVDVQNVFNAENPELTVYDYRCRGSTPVRGIPFLPVFGIRGLF